MVALPLFAGSQIEVDSSVRSLVPAVPVPIIVHAVLMTTCWAVLLPITWLALRAFKEHRQFWLDFHAMAMTLATAITIPAAAAAFSAGNGRLSPHLLIGVIITGCAVIQLMMGRAAKEYHTGEDVNASAVFKPWRIGHRGFGWFVAGLTVANVAIGFEMTARGYMWLPIAWYGLIIAAFIGIGVYEQYQLSLLRNRAKSKGVLTSLRTAKLKRRGSRQGLSDVRARPPKVGMGTLTRVVSAA